MNIDLLFSELEKAAGALNAGEELIFQGRRLRPRPEAKRTAISVEYYPDARDFAAFYQGLEDIGPVELEMTEGVEA